jgi:hypothetical protein
VLVFLGCHLGFSTFLATTVTTFMVLFSATSHTIFHHIVRTTSGTNQIGFHHETPQKIGIELLSSILYIKALPTNYPKLGRWGNGTNQGTGTFQTIDLGTVYSLHGVGYNIDWDGAFKNPLTFRVEVSTDNKTWQLASEI